VSRGGAHVGQLHLTQRSGKELMVFADTLANLLQETGDGINDDLSLAEIGWGSGEMDRG